METMDDRMEFRDDTVKKFGEGTSKWQLRATSALSFESGDSNNVFSPQDQHLQYFPQKETRTLRRSIPASWPEVLSYYRSYVTATCKSQIVSIQYVQFNRVNAPITGILESYTLQDQTTFFWNYVTTLFLKSLPHTYVQVFLATYAKDEHFYVTKMVPIFYGLTLVNSVTAFIQIIMYMESLVSLLDYNINGIAYKSPWNRCDNNYTYIDDDFHIRIYCYETEKFTKIVINEKPDFFSIGYVINFTHILNDEYKKLYYVAFNVAPTFYYMLRTNKMNERVGVAYMEFWYFIILWLSINLLYHQLFSRCIWKTLHAAQWGLNIMYLCISIHLAQDYILGQIENRVDFSDSVSDLKELIWSADVNMLAESMTAPPIIHILTSRSKRESRPNRDSSVIIASNGIYYILKGFISYRMKKYCESRFGTPIHLIVAYPYMFFYLWPIYFSNIYFGDLYCIVFFFLNFTLDFCIVVITYQCTVEAIVCEWRYAKRLIVTFVFFIMGIILFFFTNNLERCVLYLFTQGIAGMMEIIAIYVFYPINRLIDDITFFTGAIPTTIRTLNLKMVPVYYGIKLFIMFTKAYDIRAKLNEKFPIDTLLFLTWFFNAFLVIFIIGAFVACIKYIYIQKKNWISIFIPDVSWGPEYSIRQLRKGYDSREYIGSQAPRPLSRYMIQKAEAKKYTLNIKYDERDSRSKEVSDSLRFEDEKKNV